MRNHPNSLTSSKHYDVELDNHFQRFHTGQAQLSITLWNQDDELPTNTQQHDRIYIHHPVAQPLVNLGLCGIIIYNLIIFDVDSCEKFNQHTSTSSHQLWFAIQENDSPLRYMSNTQTLALFKDCVPAVHEGALIKIWDKAGVCTSKILLLPGKIRVNLGIPLILNGDSISDLSHLKGIGPKLATQIVKGRPYNSINELKEIRGIGIKLFNKIKSQVRLNHPPVIDLLHER